MWSAVCRLLLLLLKWYPSKQDSGFHFFASVLNNFMRRNLIISIYYSFISHCITLHFVAMYMLCVCLLCAIWKAKLMSIGCWWRRRAREKTQRISFGNVSLSLQCNSRLVFVLVSLFLLFLILFPFVNEMASFFCGCVWWDCTWKLLLLKCNVFLKSKRAKKKLGNWLDVKVENEHFHYTWYLRQTHTHTHTHKKEFPETIFSHHMIK